MSARLMGQSDGIFPRNLTFSKSMGPGGKHEDVLLSYRPGGLVLIRAHRVKKVMWGTFSPLFIRREWTLMDEVSISDFSREMNFHSSNFTI